MLRSILGSAQHPSSAPSVRHFKPSRTPHVGSRNSYQQKTDQIIYIERLRRQTFVEENMSAEKVFSMQMAPFTSQSATSSAGDQPEPEASHVMSVVPGHIPAGRSPNEHSLEEFTEGDPLHDDTILMQGLRIVEAGDDGALNTIRKVPSDQVLPMFRWGTKYRATGRSKTGLQILVPRRELQETVVTSGPFTGKSIVYAYMSSSSSSGRTTNSFGAVGDHLPPEKASSLSPSEDVLGTVPTQRSPLADLLIDSIPDQDAYKLLVVGEIGPCRQHTQPFAVSPSDFPLLPPRRRSLSDLVENPNGLPSSNSLEGPNLTEIHDTAGQVKNQPEKTSNVWLNESNQPPNLEDDSDLTEPLVAPVWQRRGLPFELIYLKATGRHLSSTSNHELDPATFQLPFGSKIFIMKSPSVYDLRASVITGVWSSSKGANKVLQTAWEAADGDEKIILLFSITQSLRLSGKYCGMAEMSGPYKPDADPQMWIEGLQGKKGVIPIRWIMAKNVDYSEFDDLQHKGKAVTEVRHANTVPGDAGRCLVQTYFEHEHASTADIHPGTETPVTTPIRTPTKQSPIKRRTWWASRAFEGQRRPLFHPGPSQDMPSYQTHSPDYGPPWTEPNSGNHSHLYPEYGPQFYPSPASYQGQTPLNATTYVSSRPVIRYGDDPNVYPAYGYDSTLFRS